MAQWHNGPDGERWRLETVGEDEYLIVSFPNRVSAELGIEARTSRGLTLLETEDVGRVIARFTMHPVRIRVTSPAV